jgi:hypothetical protein
MQSGILGTKKEEVVGRVVPKQQFQDIFMQDAQLKQKTAEAVKGMLDKEKPAEEAITQLNDALSGKNQEAKQNEKELEELNKFSKEDIELASQLLFNGFAKKDIKINSTVSATVVSSSSMEMAIVNELMYELSKKSEDKEGRVDKSQKDMDLMYQLYILAISFKGYNDKDIAQKGSSLEMIKKACGRLSDLEIDGNIEEHAKMMEKIKIAIKVRASEIKKLPATIVDILSMKRFEFEREMYEILTKGDVLPKS